MAAMRGPHGVATFVPLDMAKAETDWKALAEKTAERLRISEATLADTSASADEMRGRMQKYKQRLDTAQRDISRLQGEVVSLTSRLEQQTAAHAEQVAEMTDRLARQDVIKKKVYELRQSLLDGPIWELFAEL